MTIKSTTAYIEDDSTDRHFELTSIASPTFYINAYVDEPKILAIIEPFYRANERKKKNRFRKI